VAKTNSKAKDRYNENAYARYTIRVRKDSELFEEIERFMSLKGTSLNFIVNQLLSDFFESRAQD
jgi:hypothetical protein